MIGSGFLQPTHLILILIVVLIIFGPGKLPDVGKAIGKSIREFKSATSGEESDKAKAEPEKEEKDTADADKKK